MKRWFLPLGILFATLALFPLAMIARARVETSSEPALHVIFDMDNQERFKAQQENSLFADGRAMRSPVPGTVARGELREDAHYFRGMVADAQGKPAAAWATRFPARVELNEALLRRGQGRYQIYCSPCHGLSGHGDGMVARRVLNLKLKGRAGVGGWQDPASYHSEKVRAISLGELFHVISQGKNNMAGYGAQVPVHDRWAIAAYVRALQYSQQPPQ